MLTLPASVAAAVGAARVGAALRARRLRRGRWWNSCDGGGAGSNMSLGSLTWLHQGAGVVANKDMHRFVKECMEKVGAPEAHAVALADVLVAADYRGHYSHGLNRLEMYVRDVETKATDGAAAPVVLKETPATAWVDGRNGLGPVVGTFCMRLAIQKAKDVGVGWVVAKGSNHYGIAGWYSLMAVEENLIGMSCTNTSPFMSPTRARDAALGTNPIAVAAPAKYKDSFVLDMATTAVAVGKIEVLKRKGEPIPEGWAQDADGKITTDANDAMEAARLMPLGGAEETSGYKGYGLGLMVEVFCGILGGSLYGPNIRRWGSVEEEADLGQCFMAINPDCFAPGFQDRMYDLMYNLRGMDPVELEKRVLVPGDPEREHMKKCDMNGGISYTSSLLSAAMALAEKFDVEPVRVR